MQNGEPGKVENVPTETQRMSNGSRAQRFWQKSGTLIQGDKITNWKNVFRNLLQPAWIGWLFFAFLVCVICGSLLSSRAAACGHA